MKSFNDLRDFIYASRITKILLVFSFLCVSICSVKAQSISQNFPTPITANEINGKIPARDLGDARLTSYFYAFNAAQGDVFINVLTANLNGDIDVFTADNLRPLTKITLYADASDSETGRVIYLRQATKLILRIEGRTPNDNPATYRIKFAGSFVPAESIGENTNSETPQVKSDNQTEIRVNSVGTIISVKPTPQPKEVVTEIPVITETDVRKSEKTETNATKNKARPRKNQTAETIEKPIVEDKDDEATKNEVDSKTAKTVISEDKSETVKRTEPVDTVKRNAKTTPKTEPKEAKKSSVVKPVPAIALENIRLIVLFKDGTKIERPMSDVLKVGVDKGILTVISKDGQIGRYSILDVEKMTIE